MQHTLRPDGYKLSDIIAQVLQEENRHKANSVVGSSLNKFSMVKNLNHKCAKCGKTNHSTQNHWEKGNHPQRGKTPKASTLSRNKKKLDKKRKGKEKAKESLNALSIVKLPKVNTFSSQSIDFSCYVKGDNVEWLLDSGCTEHVTPVKATCEIKPTRGCRDCGW